MLVTIAFGMGLMIIASFGFESGPWFVLNACGGGLIAYVIIHFRR